MKNSIYKTPQAQNEKILDYAPGSPEKAAVLAKISELKKMEMEAPMFIGGKEVYTDDRVSMHSPHDINHTLGNYSKGSSSNIEAAIQAALQARKDWANMPWTDRAAIFLRAADLIAGPRRSYMSATTMMAQSKNVYQAEIDAIAELADFYRFNVQFMSEIYSQQPKSSSTVWNSLEYRPLEGFVFALTPFNFTAIAGNLPGAPALMGNTVVWKPAESQIYAASAVMRILIEAGLPPGVINLVYASGPVVGESVFSNKDFAGLHFTGSTGVFNRLWGSIGNNALIIAAIQG